MDALHLAMAATIRALAKKRGITITHLPDRAGVGAGHFWDVLKGESSPTVLWLERIAAVLEVQVADLVAMPPQGSGRLPGNP
ncbi:MAG: helix-turn-helix transcriptional regulator [Byssovorax sp.]